MIATVTFNPSIDYIVQSDCFELGKVNRTTKELLLPGGKGINVSIVLNNLGVRNVAYGFVAGFTGKEIERRLISEFSCCCDFVHVKSGFSRINVKLKSAEETELNGSGPNISEDDVNLLLSKLDQLKEGDFLVLSGSVPDCISEDIYERILERVERRGVKTVVDATKHLLLNALKYQPFLIKPNHHELQEAVGHQIESKQDAVICAKILQEKGARNVLVSMASQGAVLVNEHGEVLMSESCKGTVVNSVGAGDSMVAGFIAGYLKNGSFKEALEMGIAAGSASAFSVNLATLEETEQMLKQLRHDSTN